MNNLKRIILGVFAISLALALAVGATVSQFEDTETSDGNTFTTGSLDLVLGESVPLPFAILNAQPGDGGEGKVTLTNNGSLPGTLNIDIENFVQAENGLNDPELAAGDYENGGDLWISFEVKGYVDVNKDGVFNAGDIQITYNGQQAAYPGFWGGDFHWHGITSNLSPWNNVLTLAPGQSVDVVLGWRINPVWTYPNYNQNIIQTDSLGFDVEFTLTQVTP